MGLTTKEIGSSSFNDMISSVDRRSEYVENRAGANVRLNNFLTPYTLDNKSSILNAPCGYSNGTYASLRPVQTIGPELVTNGTFDTDSDWTKGTGWSIANGKASRTAQSGSTACDQSISLIAGKKYKIVYTLTISAGSFNVRFSGTTNVNGLSRTTSGTYVDYLVAATGNNTFRLVGADGSFFGSIDNVSVKEVTDADFDFSRGSSATRVNEQGLIEDVQILSGNLVQNGDFEQIGSEEITNGDFSSTDISMITGAGTRSVVNGELKIEESGVAFSQVIYNGILDASKTYKATFDITLGTGIYNVYGTTQGLVRIYSSGSYTFYLKSTERFYVGSNGVGDVWYMDNVSVKEVGQNWQFVGDFETDGTKAFITSASQYSQLTNQTGVNYLLSGNKYRLTFDIPTLSISGAFAYRYTGGSVTPILTSDIQNGKFTTEFTMPSNGWFWLQTTGSYTGLNVEVDNISVIEITDDTDIPRIDYTNGTGSLLLEPQSTNYLPYSEDFSQWSALNGPSIDLNFAISPDGTQNASKFNFDGTTNGRVELQITGLTSGQPITFSVWLKTLSGTEQVYIGHSSFGLKEVTVTDQWQRYTSSTVATQSYAYPRVRMDSASSVLVWGYQVEQKSYATSYIPTEGSTVTRAADVAINSGNADLFNDSEGVLYAEFSDFSNNVGALRFINIADVSNVFQNRISLGFRQDNRILFEVKNNNNTEMVYFDNTTNVLQFNKMCIKYKNNDCSVFINGVKVHEDNSATIPSNLNTLVMAGFTNGTYAFQGNLKSVAVFKEALTDAELAQITSATQQEVFYEMRDRMNIKNYDYYEFGDYTTRLKKLF